MPPSLRDMLSGAVLRKIAGIVDTGAAILGLVEHPDGDEPVDKGDSDIWVWAKAVLTEAPVLGRLFVPGNMLWRLPRKGDSCMVVRPADGGTAGEPYVFHGDAGTVPSWLDADNAGISAPEVLHIESTDKKKIVITTTEGTITIESGKMTLAAKAGQNIALDVSGGGAVVLDSGTLKVARVTDPTTGHGHTVTGFAGYYPITSGQAITATDTIASSAGAANVKA